jgi:F0F1-type ATP synthase assembly protein I
MPEKNIAYLLAQSRHGIFLTHTDNRLTRRCSRSHGGHKGKPVDTEGLRDALHLCVAFFHAILVGLFFGSVLAHATVEFPLFLSTTANSLFN